MLFLSKFKEALQPTFFWSLITGCGFFFLFLRRHDCLSCVLILHVHFLFLFLFLPLICKLVGARFKLSLIVVEGPEEFLIRLRFFFQLLSKPFKLGLVSRIFNLFNFIQFMNFSLHSVRKHVAHLQVYSLDVFNRNSLQFLVSCRLVNCFEVSIHVNQFAK